MTTRCADIDKLLILVNVDDPITYDKEFMNYLTYGSLAKDVPQFTDANRKRTREMDRGPLAKDKFIIELYTDRLDDFVYNCVSDGKHYRALIFRCVQIEPMDNIPDDAPEELVEELQEICYIYELRTVGTITQSEADEPEETEVDDSDEVEPSMEASSFFTAPKLLH